MTITTREYGWIHSVTTRKLGSALAAATPADSDELWVTDTAKFDKIGGELIVAGDVLTYTSVDFELDVLFLAAPTLNAYDADESVSLWNPVTASPMVNVEAQVELLNVDSEDDTIPASVSQGIVDALPEGDRGGRGETVVLSKSGTTWTVVDIDGEELVRDGSYLDVDTLPPIEAEPTPVPPVSPTPVTQVGPAAAIVTWAPTVGLRYELHVSADNTITPTLGGPTAHSTTADAGAWVYTFPDGSVLPSGNNVYVALIALNAVGDFAPESPWVAAQAGAIPPEFIQVLAGEIIAQAMNTDSFRANTIVSPSLDVAGILLNAIVGLFVPGVSGSTRLSVPLDPAQPIQILAFVEALGAIFRDNITIRGLNNFLHGLLKLGNGVSDPSTPPTISSAWDSLSIGTSSNVHGLTDSVSTVNWITAYNFGGPRVVIANKGTGATITDDMAGANVLFDPDGGITRIGSNYYVLGQDLDRSNDWYVYRLDSTFTKTGEARLFAASDLNRSPAIGNDGTNVLVAYTRINTTLRLRTYPVSEFTTTPNSSTATASSIDDLPVTGSPYNITGVHKGSFFGVSNHLIITGLSGPMWVFNASLARVTSLEPPRAGGTKLQGLHHDGTRFRHLDDIGRLWDYSLHDGSSKPYTYTWYDGDAGGTGTAESKPSPAAVFAVPRGARPVIATPPPDDDGTSDAPDRVMVYAQNVRQATYNVGELSRSFDSLAGSGTAAPTTSGFASRPASAPGALATAASDGEGPLVDITGDGSWRLGALRNSGTDAVIGAAGSAISVARRGTVTANTDASGQVTVTHALGTTPAQVWIQKVGGGSRTAELQSKSSTTFVVQSRDEGGSATATGTSITFDWLALA